MDTQSTISKICELFRSGIIQKIKYSYQVNIDLEGDPQFFDIVGGPGWSYSPLDGSVCNTNTVMVPDAVRKLLAKIPKSFFGSVSKDEKLRKKFYDDLLKALEGLDASDEIYCQVKKWGDPTMEPKFSSCAEVIAA